jgi:hypothetical protein
MATYFVFGNAPKINELMDFKGKDEKSGEIIKIETTDDKSGHCIVNINGHITGAQIDLTNVITAIYPIDSDNEGLRLLNLLIEQWSEENSLEERDIATTVIDDEMSLYLEYM